MRNQSIGVAALVALAAVATGCGSATGIVVEQGNNFKYESASNMTMSISMLGQDQETTGKGDITTELTVLGKSGDAITWMINTPRVHMVMQGGGEEKDTVTSGRPTRFTTNKQGVITSIDETDGGRQMMQMIGGGLGGDRGAARRFFLPARARSAAMGESWEEIEIDTMTIQEMGVPIHTNATVRYTLDGPVDTLGVKTIRVRAQMTGMTLEGSGDVAGQGINMAIDGDGTSSSVLYYAATDGLLYARTVESDINLRLAVPAQQFVMSLGQKSNERTLRTTSKQNQ
jgi:hypothetical protein